MPAREAIPRSLVEEGERVMRLCNACRYCEGYCAVFPALERRLTFGERDLEYLANLCHNCRECYYACQYAPPQEFELNFPRTLAQLRASTYRKYAWPPALAGLFRRGGSVAAAAAAIAVAAFLAGAWAANPGTFLAAHPVAAGSFHALVGHGAMVAVFGVASAVVALALGLGALAYWRCAGRIDGTPADARGLAQGLYDALRLRYLDGGREGCAYPGEVSSYARRWFHHLTFYGFLLCFASTTLAAAYHYALGWHAPYPVLSLPVILGTVGGVAILVGSVGLLCLKALRDPVPGDPEQTALDLAFLVLLAISAASGLALLAFRESAGMGVLLALHLGVVLALFATMPYGKFVHGVYRLAALVRYAVERRTVPRFGAE